MPSLDDQQYAQMRPYLALAEKLGAFLANVVSSSGSVQQIALRYSGRITEWNTELIRNSAVQGVLNQRMAEHANVVNAAALAYERGIHVHERKEHPREGRGGDVVARSLQTATAERPGTAAL